MVSEWIQAPVPRNYHLPEDCETRSLWPSDIRGHPHALVVLLNHECDLGWRYRLREHYLDLGYRGENESIAYAGNAKLVERRLMIREIPRLHLRLQFRLFWQKPSSFLTATSELHYLERALKQYEFLPIGSRLLKEQHKNRGPRLEKDSDFEDYQITFSRRIPSLRELVSAIESTKQDPMLGWLWTTIKS